MNFETARCPRCGATIQVPTDRDRARCMMCGEELEVQAAIQAHRNPVIAPALPHPRDVLQVALEFIDNGNLREADAQLTRVLEHEPANGAVWMCKALIATDADQVNGYAQKGFDCGFAASELKAELARRFESRAVALIGLSDGPGDDLGIERNSASGYIDEAHRQAFAAGVHCDFAFQYLTLAFANFGVSYELAPSAEIGDALTLLETLVNHMPPVGRVVDSPDGYPYEAKNWFHYTLPAIYELRRRIRRDFPQEVPVEAVTPLATTAKGDAGEGFAQFSTSFIVGVLGFIVTFGMGLLRRESAQTSLIVGLIGAVVAFVWHLYHRASKR